MNQTMSTEISREALLAGDRAEFARMVEELKLRYAVEHRKGTALVAGLHGTGKTYLTYVLERELGPERYPLSRIVFPQLSPSELLHCLANRLGAATGAADATGPGSARVLQRLEAPSAGIAVVVAPLLGLARNYVSDEMMFRAPTITIRPMVIEIAIFSSHRAEKSA